MDWNDEKGELLAGLGTAEDVRESPVLPPQSGLELVLSLTGRQKDLEVSYPFFQMITD